MCKHLFDDLEESILYLFLITFEHVIENGRQIATNHLGEVTLLLLLTSTKPIQEKSPVFNLLVLHHTLQDHFDRQLKYSSLTV